MNDWFIIGAMIGFLAGYLAGGFFMWLGFRQKRKKEKVMCNVCRTK